MLGGVVPANEAVGVGVHGFSFFVFASLEVDVDGLADQASIELVHGAMQADGTVTLNFAVELEEEQFIEVALRAG